MYIMTDSRDSFHVRGDVHFHLIRREKVIQSINVGHLDACLWKLPKAFFNAPTIYSDG